MRVIGIIGAGLSGTERENKSMDAKGKVAKLAKLLYSIYGWKHLYQDVEHPYFGDWAVARSAARFAPMWRTCKSLGTTGGTHVDIGCNTGRITRQFAAFGFDSVGFDTSKTCVEVCNEANTVLISKGKRPEFVHGKWDGRPCDVMTCLSVFHSFFRKGKEDAHRETYRKMAAQSKVLITDCVVDPKEYCMNWEKVEDFAKWLTSACGKPVYLLDFSDRRPLLVVTDLPVVRNLTEPVPPMKEAALNVSDVVVTGDEFSRWIGRDLRKMPHFDLFLDIHRGNKLDLNHRYVRDYLYADLKYPEKAATATLKHRTALFNDIKDNGIQNPIWVVLDEYGIRRVDGHHRATISIVLDRAVTVKLYDMTGLYNLDSLPALP